jgi:hypothetical protein
MTKPVASFDHLTRASQQSWLQFHAESFCGFEIEDLSAAMAGKSQRAEYRERQSQDQPVRAAA